MHHILAHVPLLLCCLEVIRSQGISAWVGKREGQGTHHILLMYLSFSVVWR